MRFSSKVHRSAVTAAAGFAVTLAMGHVSQAATIPWKGHTWNVTAGGMAGVCQGNAGNVSIDTSGYLHLKITNNGGTWTGAEIFSTDKIGFGTYQWQIEGSVDKYDKNVVVGLYPYGPAAGIGGDGNNEIDIEFARWGNASWPNGNYTVYPPTGTTSGSSTFEFSLNGGTSTTTRFVWSSTKIDFATMSGFESVDSTTGLINAWTFAPANPTTKVPQQALPLGMNLWCYDNPPSDGQNVEIVVRDFQFVPLGTVNDGGVGGSDGSAGAGDVAGAGGAGGSAGTDAAVDKAEAGSGGGSTGTGGATSRGGSTGTGGAAGTGGAMASGGATGTGGAAGRGGAAGTGGAIATGGAFGTGGSVASSGAVSTGGAGGTGGSKASGGSAGSGGAAVAGGSPQVGGSAGTGGAAGSGGSAGTAGTNSAGGCTCRVAGHRSGSTFVLLAVSLLALRWRRRARHP